jgi:YfiH family protein
MFKLFQNFKNLKYGLSQKTDGAMELADVDFNLRFSRNKFFYKVDLNPNQTLSADLKHSSKVIAVTENNAGQTISDCDGLITKGNNLYLTITVADCFPIYFYNPKTNATALAHSGWRGTIANIAGKSIASMGGVSSDILVGIGPGIQACHFEIKEDILDQFKNYPEEVVRREGKIFIDLPKIIIVQLVQGGVPAENIENFGECTYCQKDKYFSFRRDKPKLVQAMVAYIGIL